jgi:hypothetical protein
VAWYDYLNPLTGVKEGGRKMGLWGESDAQRIREKGFAEAQAEQERLARDMDQQRQRDLEATMGFYGPAQAALGNLYGIPASAWGPGLTGRQPGGIPPKSGMLNGMPVSMPGMRPDFAGLSGRGLGSPTQSLPAGTRLSAPKRPLFSKMGRLG